MKIAGFPPPLPIENRCHPNCPGTYLEEMLDGEIHGERAVRCDSCKRFESDEQAARFIDALLRRAARREKVEG